MRLAQPEENRKSEDGKGAEKCFSLGNLAIRHATSGPKALRPDLTISLPLSYENYLVQTKNNMQIACQAFAVSVAAFLCLFPMLNK